jgi:hypothetical protein
MTLVTQENIEVMTLGVTSVALEKTLDYSPEEKMCFYHISCIILQMT